MGKVRQKSVLIALLVIFLISLGAVIGYVVSPRDSEGTTLSSANETTNPLASLTASFPLYYPEQMPSGYWVVPETTTSQGGVVTFSIQSNTNKRLFVTQQSRPPLMEKVKKTKEFKTPIGDAYIADLEGHTTGFLLAEKTLIIVSNAAQDDTGILELLLLNLKPVN